MTEVNETGESAKFVEALGMAETFSMDGDKFKLSYTEQGSQYYVLFDKADESAISPTEGNNDDNGSAAGQTDDDGGDGGNTNPTNDNGGNGTDLPIFDPDASIWEYKDENRIITLTFHPAEGMLYSHCDVLKPKNDLYYGGIHYIWGGDDAMSYTIKEDTLFVVNVYDSILMRQYNDYPKRYHIITEHTDSRLNLRYEPYFFPTIPQKLDYLFLRKE